MDNNKLIYYIENSFLRDLLSDENITDISYNGNSIFYMHNLQGRKKSKTEISSTDAKDFIRQIANLTEKQFSYQTPILDVTAGKYRLNAVHNSIGRTDEDQVITFSIRVASSTPKITDKSDFMTAELVSLFNALIKSNVSIAIGGITGTGKTEFQKYLLGKMEIATRVIIIDNVLELSQLKVNENVDFNIWQADEKLISTDVQTLVKNALRSNPDWLIIAESRGGEMLEILNASMTGHPVITTIHAYSAFNMPNRIARMVMMNDKRSDYYEIIKDVSENFPFHVHLSRKINREKKVVRYIDMITAIDKNGKMHKIYEFKKGEHIYHHLPKDLLDLFSGVDDELFISKFGGGKNETI